MPGMTTALPAHFGGLYSQTIQTANERETVRYLNGSGILSSGVPNLRMHLEAVPATINCHLLTLCRSGHTTEVQLTT